MQTKEYELFISYAEADRAWVEGYLLDALSEAGINYLSEAAFALGAPRIAEFERAIQQSDRALLILSRAYLANDVTQFTRLLAQSYGREQGIWPVIPLLREDALELPPSLGALVPLTATDEETWETAIERLCRDLQRPVPPLSAKPACPYPGMRPFSEGNSHYFFGRDREIDQLLQSLYQQRFTCVIGPSGSGKSSVVFAGLLPALQRSGLFGSGDWCIRTIRPGQAPLAALTAALGNNNLANPTDAVAATLATQPNAQRLLLVVDQFEEIFTQSEQAATPFQESLRQLLEQPNCYGILTIRADFYPELMQSLLWPKIQDSRVEVIPLATENLYEAIVKPAGNVNVFIEAALVERLVADANEEPGVLPLVQETMVLLWERVERRFLPMRAYDTMVLTNRAYESLDGSNRRGLQAVIANHADATLIQFPSEQRQIAQRIFLRLIQFGEGRADTRRQQSVEQLKSSADEPNQFHQVLNCLADNRLLTLNTNKEGSCTSVDIAHESLIESWPALQWWLQEQREAEQTRRQLTRQAQEWLRLGKGQGGLLDEAELLEARNWLNRYNADELGSDTVLQELVEVSAQAIQANKRRKQRTRIAVVVAASAAMLAALGFLFQRNQTRQNQINALTASSEAHLLDDAQLEALIDSVKAGEKLNWPVFGLSTSIRLRTIATLQQAVDETQEVNRLEGHSQRVNSVSVCSTSRHIATGSDDGTIRLWQPDGTSATTPLKERNAERVTSVAFSPDCKTLVSTRADGKMTLWDAANGIPIKELSGHPGQYKGWVNEVSFSSDGKLFATASRDHTVKLWDAVNGQLLKTLEGHQDFVNGVSFSPDSKTLISAGEDSAIKLWNVRDGRLIQDLQISQVGRSTAVQISPEGQTLASAEENGIVKLWKLPQEKVDPQAEILLLNEHQDRVTSLCFTPEGHFLVSASMDSTVKLWRVADGTLYKTLRGHKDAVLSISCGLSDRNQSLKLISTSADKTIRIWNVSTQEPSIQSAFYSTKFSPDSKKISAAGWDGMVWVWDNSGATSPKLFFNTQDAHEAPVNIVRFSSDGQILASGSDDKTIRLWDSADGKLLETFTGHQDRVTDISFSPNGKLLASAADLEDSTIKLWELATGKPIDTLTGHQAGIASVAFSPNGQRLASGGYDNTVKLWRLDGESWQLIHTLQTKSDDPGLAIADLSFSPDGKILASASWDNTIKLWQVRSGRLLKILTGNKGGVTSIAFNPDGKTLVSSSADRTIRFWDIKSGRVVKTLLRIPDSAQSLGFSDDGKLLIGASEEEGLLFWNLDLEDLLEQGCDRIRNYLKTNPNVKPADRHICD